MLDKMFFEKQKRIRNYRQQKGFTLIELLLVLALSTIIFGWLIFNLMRLQNSSVQRSIIEALISDIKSQQLKAMIGHTEDRVDNDSYGIYFYTDRYVLFHGDTFDENSPDNFEIELPDNLEFESTTLPNSSLVFSQVRGEFLGYTPDSNTVTINALNLGDPTIITINRYGVISNIE